MMKTAKSGLFVLAVLCAAVAALLVWGPGPRLRMPKAASVGIIGGSDGPTAIFISGKATRALGTRLLAGLLRLRLALLALAGMFARLIAPKRR